MSKALGTIWSESNGAKNFVTLVVLAFRRTTEGKLVKVSHDKEGSGDPTLAGAESTRESFYGGELAAYLDLKLFPQLKDSDLWIYGRDLITLEKEVNLLLKNLKPKEREHWEYRLGNIKSAIARALPFGEDGVVYVG